MFLLPPRADGFDDRSPFGSFWWEPVTTRSVSGQRVGADGAMRLSAVYACVRVLAESFSVLPLQITRMVKGEARPTTRHPLYRLLAVRPCDTMNPFAWRELLMGHLALRGNAFCRIITDGAGTIEQLPPIHPDLVQVERLDNGSWRYRVKVPGRPGEDEVLTRNQVWHIRALSGDGIVGMNPIELARDNLGEALDAQAFGARWYANDAKPTSGWIEAPLKFKDEPARETFRETLHRTHGGMNRGKMMVLEGGMKYHQLGITQEDMQFLEGRQFKVGEIARIFRVPPHKIGDLSKATFSNIEQQALEFWTDTMHPWCERFEAAIKFDLMLERDQDRFDVEFDMRGMMRGDTVARTAYYQGGIQSGWMTRNEARAAEGLPKLDGLDEPLQPLNMATKGQITALPKPDNPDDETDGQ